ncbi:MAG: 1-deoxy-D-xylulose-5-phosphate reductoisomerase [Candidatus Omnitrophica bacterium]|nr:1-deoxy-D-xylulose-5-phosphate reductoisomerase [Candidatus Omnitrophota bacterium]
MKHISLIGSTGSIGESTLSVIRAHPTRFKVSALAVRANVSKLLMQIKEFEPQLVCVYDEKAAHRLRKALGRRALKVLSGNDGLNEVAKMPQSDVVLCAAVGACGLGAIFSAIEAGKAVGIANKEPLVVAGHLIMKKARERKTHVLPIDSEHSAIWQCLQNLNGHTEKTVERLILTASGGPFFGKTRWELRAVTPSQAVNHPRWRMGRKISVDSATLMNKGLEVKEAHHLFDIPLERIDVLIHRQAVIHSMVEFVDGSHMAQLAVNDMKLPIQFALSYPERLRSQVPKLDFLKIHSLTFERPDRRTFPCLDLACSTWRQGGTAPAVLNAANEIAVARFLNGDLSFLGIPNLIERVLARHRSVTNPDLNQILEADSWAREEAMRI